MIFSCSFAHADTSAENEKKLLYNLKNKLDYKPTIIFITHNEDIIKYADYSYCIKGNQLYNINNETEK